MRTSPLPGKMGRQPRPITRRAGNFVAVAMIMFASSLAQRGDYLTSDEVDRIREAQEIVPRTQEYLRVAASRVAEIARRTGKKYDVKVPDEKEVKKKKPKKGAPETIEEPENPLLFFAFHDVVNAISQSLRAIMTNLDEKVKMKRAEPKDLLKALKLLDAFTAQDFSLLEDLEAKARSDQDINLHRAVRGVQESLGRAREGAKLGLSTLEETADAGKKKKGR